MENKQTSFQKIMGFINKAGQAIMMNLLFLVSCIPVVTIGAALSGLYSAVRYSIRGDGWFEGYKQGFKTRFLRNTVGWVFGLGVGLYALNNVYLYVTSFIADPDLISAGTVVPAALHLVFFLSALLLTTAMVPTNLYFDTDVNTWLMNAWYLIGHAPLQVLAVGVLMWLPVAVILWFPVYGFYSLLVFVGVYYTFMGVLATALLKNPLIQILQRQQEQDET